MTTDRQGNALIGATPAAARLFDQALESFSLYRGDPAALATQALAEAPQLAMARVLLAWLGLISTEPAAVKAARGEIDLLASVPGDERVTAHLVALRHMAAGRVTAAALALEQYSCAHPLDLLALQAGHLLDFLRADARSLRDRIARALPHWSPQVPGHAQVLGMHAFGLEECADYGRAEDTGRRAVALQPLDVWAHHAVAHVMEMQGRPEDGIGWMIAREAHWGAADNFFKVHNWWHRALFHLDIGQMDEALALYDGPVREARSPVAFDLVDASALLWRLHLLGMDLGDRWQELAEAWNAHADGRTYAFNDWHAVMALLGADRHADVDRVVSACRNASGSEENVRWAREYGLPLIEGFRAFWRRDYNAAIGHLHGARRIAYGFGGSHAQRDIIDWTLAESALRAGRGALARGFADERLALKPHGAIARGMLARATAGMVQQRAA